MKKIFNSLLRPALARFDVELVKRSVHQAETVELNTASGAARDLKFLQALPREFAPQFLDSLSDSQAQLRQDLFALYRAGFKRSGFFVEFGATDGRTLSNTYLLEKNFGWSGILAEPARGWHDKLRATRSAVIDTRCVWRETGAMLTFSEAEDGELSSLSEYAGVDHHAESRKRSTSYTVETISLNDLLDMHEAPAVIDYLSVDTEGSEFEILTAFDFSKHRFQAITCEHNYTPVRADIHDLLTRNGYRQVLDEVSAWDDWYVPADSRS